MIFLQNSQCFNLYFLLKADLINTKYGYLSIRQLAQYYVQICEMMKELDEDSGPTLLLSFMLEFLHLMITPYNLLASIGKCGVKLYISTFNFTLLTFSG